MDTLLLAASGGTGRFVDLDIHIWEWAGLLGFITALLLFDVLVVHRRPHEIRFKEAAIESAVWISIGLAFTGVVYYIGRTSGVGPDGVHGVDAGAKAAGEYISGFLIEKSLSIDNVFVWAVIFSYFAVPAKYQFRTLFWGIFGALVLRAAFIFAGLALIQAVAFTLVVFGLVLLYTAQKIAFHDDATVDPDTSLVLRVVRRIIPSTSEYDGQHLFTKVDGRHLATPLLAVLIMIETTDVVFAVDSVPAILAVSEESFIVFSSNAFAILGLRALYFLLNGMQDRFRYLNYGLGAILAFVGAKMILTFTGERLDFPTEDFHISTPISLGVIVVVLAVTIVASLRADRRDGPPDGDGPDPGETADPAPAGVPGATGGTDGAEG
ncbi:TerC family protein [Iamia majanohamensis]|uniref:TerC family protein n=1 Tax=Iamia majanohamensis TaxID=467976 RepID=A0AAE9Y4X3_9ACTN|nr:TerC family protein [Iamia majanohamensis]WCO65296.1 TerC family protein [Iamia majanohamensis]